ERRRHVDVHGGGLGGLRIRAARVEGWDHHDGLLGGRPLPLPDRTRCVGYRHDGSEPRHRHLHVLPHDMIRALALLLVPQLALAAGTFAYRPAEATDDQEIVRIRNAAAMPRIDYGTWLLADAAAFRASYPGTQLVTLDGAAVAVIGSTDWTQI